MKIELINGTFSREDSMELLKELITAKIKFHEKKITQSDQLEDIQFREKKIKKLMEILKQIRTETISSQRINLTGEIQIDLIK